MEFHTEITASTSLCLYPECGGDQEVSVAAEAGARRAGGRDFLASLNQGVGKALLDAYAENRTDANRNALATHYGLCAQVVARQVYRSLTPDSRRQVDVGDAEQTAMALLIQLVEKFDVSLGIPLSAFLTRRLRYAMIDEYRREGLMVRTGRGCEERPKCVSLERAVQSAEVRDGSRGPAARLERRDARRALLLAVPREHRLFVVFRFLRGMQLWQVAKRLNVTCERAAEMQDACMVRLGAALGVKVVTRQVGAALTARPMRERVERGPAKQEAGALMPVDLLRAKEFRRWCVRRVPWAYRKLVAYRYLRGRDIEWTAARLGICPGKAEVLDRQARPFVLRVVAEYREGRVAMVA